MENILCQLKLYVAFHSGGFRWDEGGYYNHTIISHKYSEVKSDLWQEQEKQNTNILTNIFCHIFCN
jgi:hypothetical protein